MSSERLYIRFMFKDHIVHACRSLFIAFHVLACVSMSAQSSQIISSLVDVSRNNRVIDLDVRVPVESLRPLPWVVFGHGFDAHFGLRCFG